MKNSQKLLIVLLTISNLNIISQVTTSSSNNDRVKWEAENKSTFNKISATEWSENNPNSNKGSFFYIENSKSDRGILLQDKNRVGVFIYLEKDKCQYKDLNTDWYIIKYGSWVEGSNYSQISSEATTQNNTQTNGLKEGKTIIYDSLGNKFGEGNFIKGLQNGAWVYYFNTGEKKADVNFLNGDGGNKGATGIPKNGREGLFNSYYKNGKLDQVSNFKAGKQDGLSTFYYENGNKHQVLNYTAGKLDGLATFYYENGKLKEVSNFKADKLDGLATFYYENGKLKEVSNFKADKRDGLCTFYDENGNKDQVSNRTAGEKNGLTTFYYENGNKDQVLNYTAGKLDGLATFYYETGALMQKRNYSNGKEHGDYVSYYENGKIKNKEKVDTTSLALYNLIGDWYEYNEDGSINNHGFAHRSGKIDYDKNLEKKSQIPQSELNKPFKCKCCKAAINGFAGTYNSEGREFEENYFMFEMIGYDPISKVYGFTNIYEYMRKEIYKYCTLKCARTCY